MAKSKPDRKPITPIAKDPDRLGAYANRLLQSMTGQRLCMQFDQDTKSGQSVHFWLSPSGRRARPDAAQELIRKGRVAPLSDGLFSDAPAQTFEVVQ